jgi:hypothetical protein
MRAALAVPDRFTSRQHRQPPPKPLRLTERPNVLDDPQANLLQHIVEVLCPPKDTVHQPLEPPPVGLQEPLQGLFVASTRRDNQ